MSQSPRTLFFIVLSTGLVAGCVGEVTTGSEQLSSITGESTPSTREECFVVEVCGNQLDDDCDGKKDCADADCKNAVTCSKNCDASEEICGNGIDDNCDGQIDEGCPGLCAWSQFDCSEVPQEVAHCNGDESCYEAWVASQCNYTVTTTVRDGQKVFECNDKSECAKFSCQVQSTTTTPPTPPPPSTPPACVWETHNCSDGAFGHCNLHDGGNEVDCRAMGNPGGCPEYVFKGWCTRRVDTGQGGAWFQAVKKWVEDQCGGPADLVMDDRGESLDLYRCQNDNACKIYQCETPLVLAFDSDLSVVFVPDDGQSRFDLSADQNGAGRRSDWPTAATPWLALDVDRDGQISSGRELFGSATLISGGTAHQGFEALGTLDPNGDGVVDARDPRFEEILVWADRDGDRISSRSELRSLTDLGVVSLSLAYDLQPRCDSRGNCERQRASFSWRDPKGELRQGAVIDVNLALQVPAMITAAARGFIPSECPTEETSLLRLLGDAPRVFRN